MARESGAALIVCNSAEDAVREEHNLDLLVQQRVQGVLITPVDEQNPRLGALLERGVPVVLLDRVSPTRNCCSVTTNDVYGGQLAGKHLVEQGHQRIAFVGDPSGIRQMHDRYEGFLEAVGPDRSEVILASNWRVDVGRAAGKELAERPPGERPTAVFCANDLLAIGVLQELTHHKIAVPEDVAIVGYDDLGLGRRRRGAADLRAATARTAGPGGVPAGDGRDRRGWTAPARTRDLSTGADRPRLQRRHRPVDLLGEPRGGRPHLTFRRPFASGTGLRG